MRGLASIAVVAIVVGGFDPIAQSANKPARSPEVVFAMWMWWTMTVDVEPEPPVEELRALLVTAALGDSTGGADVSVSVSYGGEVVSVGGPVTYESASAAKAYWVVAAVGASGVAAAAPYAEPIFAYSDNEAAGRVIDIVGIDAVNAYTSAIGMDGTYLSSWSFGGVSRTAVDATVHGFANQTTTADAVLFLDRLHSGELLDEAATATVLEWMTWSPDTMAGTALWGGVLTHQLAPEVAAATMHKAGWLPPGCCTSLDNELIAIGIVPLPDETTFSIAVVSANGSDYAGQADWVAGVVADVYSLLAGGS